MWLPENNDEKQNRPVWHLLDGQVVRTWRRPKRRMRQKTHKRIICALTSRIDQWERPKVMGLEHLSYLDERVARRDDNDVFHHDLLNKYPVCTVQHTRRNDPVLRGWHSHSNGCYFGISLSSTIIFTNMWSEITVCIMKRLVRYWPIRMYDNYGTVLHRRIKSKKTR